MFLKCMATVCRDPFERVFMENARYMSRLATGRESVGDAISTLKHHTAMHLNAYTGSCSVGNEGFRRED